MHRRSLALVFLLSPLHALAETETIIANLDIVWILVATVLVFFMQAGFALLETGMSRAKNAVNVIMKNYTDVCLASLVFFLVGYSLMFGQSNGYLAFAGLGIPGDSSSDYAIFLFQTMFAATAATICSGAMAERTRFIAYVLAAGFIVAIIYPVYGSWVWNSDGWLAQMGFIDFAGSTVVHSVGGWCALAGIIIIGPRLGRFNRHTGEVRPIAGHNLSLVGIGGFILWLGWFGFNAGSVLAANGDIAMVALVTHLSASAGVFGAILYHLVRRERILMTSIVNGSLAGLVSITSGCATMSLEFAILTGLIGGLICMASIDALVRFRLDDVVGAVSVHGVAGVWGTLTAGIFLTGNLFDPGQIAVQLLGICAAIAWTLPLALLVYKLIDLTMGLRADSLHEQRGLDVTEHAEVGYPEFQSAQTYNPEVAR